MTGRIIKKTDLLSSLCSHGKVETGEAVTRLTVEPGEAGQYRLSQQDDYSNLPRGKFLYKPPVSLSLSARVSEEDLPGTWGFGFWNDPFSAGLSIKGSGFRLPALPQAVWFFFSSSRNDLSYQSNTPVNGLTAAVFSSINVPSALLVLAAPAMLFLPVKPAARLIRRAASRVIHDTYCPLDINPTDWHTYRLDWQPDSTCFSLDGRSVFETRLSPRGPLGLVIWMDNQYACFSASGVVRFGTEANSQPGWMEFKDLEIKSIIQQS